MSFDGPAWLNGQAGPFSKHRAVLSMFEISVGDFSLMCHLGSMPSAFSNLLKHAELVEEFDVDGGKVEDCLVAVKRGFQWPTLIGLDIGTKMKLLDNLWLTAGYFDINRTNVAQNIPSGNPQRFQQFGLVRSSGMELELLGKLTEKWSVFNGFGMTDARIQNDINPVDIGRRWTNSPMHQGSLWTRYNVIQRRDRVMGMGLGVYYTDFWYISADNTYRAPGYTRLRHGILQRHRPLALVVVHREFYRCEICRRRQWQHDGSARRSDIIARLDRCEFLSSLGSRLPHCPTSYSRSLSRKSEGGKMRPSITETPPTTRRMASHCVAG